MDHLSFGRGRIHFFNEHNWSDWWVTGVEDAGCREERRTLSNAANPSDLAAPCKRERRCSGDLSRVKPRIHPDPAAIGCSPGRHWAQRQQSGNWGFLLLCSIRRVPCVAWHACSKDPPLFDALSGSQACPASWFNRIVSTTLYLYIVQFSFGLLSLLVAPVNTRSKKTHFQRHLRDEQTAKHTAACNPGLDWTSGLYFVIVAVKCRWSLCTKTLMKERLAPDLNSQVITRLLALCFHQKVWGRMLLFFNSFGVEGHQWLSRTVIGRSVEMEFTFQSFAWLHTSASITATWKTCSHLDFPCVMFMLLAHVYFATQLHTNLSLKMLPLYM